MKVKRINLHIDRLVISGLDHVNGQKVGNVVQSELQRLLRARDLNPQSMQSGTIGVINARTIRQAGTASDRMLGLKIANSVYRGIKS